MGAPIVELEQPPKGGASQTAKDLFSGAIGGMAQVLIGRFPMHSHLTHTLISTSSWV